MPDTTPGNWGRNRQKVPRIGAKEAARVLEQCEQLLDCSSVFVENLRQMGFARFLAPLSEEMLELAVQPDSWGERTRARLISYIFAGLRELAAEAATVEEIVQVSNVLVPCFLLELGRRRQHIEIKFPDNPCHSAACFEFRPGGFRPVCSLDGEQLVRLVADVGEELVGLCYFGDQPSRERVELQLTPKGSTADS